MSAPDSPMPERVSPEALPYVQDEDFWYPDGTIILVARTEVAFRVHRGVLADHSAVFRDLFAVPQPPEEECHAGCPMVNLSDAPNQMRSLLRALYHPRRYYMPDQRVSFAMVAALIHLGHKYAIDDLATSALSRLRTCFSTSFDTYYSAITAGGSQAMSCTSEDAIAAVNLARLIGEDATTILPSALYTCCQLGADVLTRGILDDGGDVQKLGDADLERCIDARARLAALAMSSAVRRCQLNSDDQETPKEGRSRCTQAFCTPYLASAASRVLCGSLGLPKLSGALDSIDWFVADSVRGGLLCHVCAAKVKDKDKQERLRIWKMLPAVLGFKLEGWNETGQHKS
ncbi:uncharacterized protein B0H18DRAFT_1112749 [Fomitopsis serialis]|uniref:uncharacterized protein n=1 Tax=Fomitopsis serialis TaxID=139415 RepID=UPI0020075694|nr:uncharacterized protein B0H18DRAFT_1112749 [Neoantrodia serialis]KAH9938613.1 hypothetical protein B0H18DRAFT_1112749 [Neoantrodia serialis]